MPPNLPITQAAYFELPFSLLNSIKYLLRAWSPLTERFFILLTAIAVWAWFTPSLERTVDFRFDWMFEIWLRNFILVLTVAGGLHLWFFTFRRQHDETRYDARPLARESKIFHFGNQVWDNMFWTLVSSVLVGTLWECLLLWGYANGYAKLISFGENPLWFIGLMVLIPIWSGFHFYWFHRLLHVRPIYKRCTTGITRTSIPAPGQVTPCIRLSTSDCTRMPYCTSSLPAIRSTCSSI